MSRWTDLPTNGAPYKTVVQPTVQSVLEYFKLDLKKQVSRQGGKNGGENRLMTSKQLRRRGSPMTCWEVSQSPCSLGDLTKYRDNSQRYWWHEYAVTSKSEENKRTVASVPWQNRFSWAYLTLTPAPYGADVLTALPPGWAKCGSCRNLVIELLPFTKYYVLGTRLSTFHELSCLILTPTLWGYFFLIARPLFYFLQSSLKGEFLFYPFYREEH